MKSYAILGHSRINNSLPIKQVPDNIILVFPSVCGQVFSRLAAFKPILRNNFLHKLWLSRENQSKEIFIGGQKYTNQQVQFSNGPNKKSKLLYGVFKLPLNKKRNILLNKTRPIMLSSLLNKISKRGGGVVIALTCRGTPTVQILNKKNVTRVGSRIIGGESAGRIYAGLRPITNIRKNFLKGYAMMNSVEKSQQKTLSPNTIKKLTFI
jgi:hypothetical protein